MNKGYIHSIESMGLVDGPGIRTVAFLQGCALRCRFCHNPDTWAFEGGTATTAEELVRRVLRFRPYFSRSGGGVTFSGGEPLQQPEFLLEALQLLKAEGVHTCIDTAGVGHGSYDALLRYTDLVLLDVKQPDPDAYRVLTGCGIEASEEFIAALRRAGTPVWVRHVVVPGQTNTPEAMEELQAYIAANIPGVQKVELLPYHRLGEAKYAAMGLDYPLAGTPAMDLLACAALQKVFFGVCSSRVRA